MTIDRRAIFIEAWKSARRMRGQYRTLRAAFAAALRRVWGLVRAMVAEDARRLAQPVRPVVPIWEAENAHRAAAVAAHRARLTAFADPNLAVTVLYQGCPVRALVRRPDRDVQFGDITIHAATSVFEIRVSEVESPTEGDTITLADEAERLVWSIDTRPG